MDESSQSSGSSDSTLCSPSTKKSKMLCKTRRNRNEIKVENPDSESSDSSASTVCNPHTKKSKVTEKRLNPQNKEGGSGTPDYIDLTNSEIRNKYKDLIEECEVFSGIEGADETVLDDMNKNITEGDFLTRCLLNPQSGAEPRDKYMAYSHSKSFAVALRVKTETMGSSSSVFSLDHFVRSVKNQFTNDREDLVATELKDVLSWQFCYAGQIVPSLALLLGTFDKTKTTKISAPAPVKEKTIRATPRQKRFDNVNATKHEVVTKEKEKKKVGKESADMLSKSILEVLKSHGTSENAPVNFVEFSFDKSSLARTVENMFCAGFLARDGFISLSRNSDARFSIANLVIEPAMPPVKDVGRHPPRQQFIWSFTPQQWKKIVQESVGDNVIPTSLSKK